MMRCAIWYDLYNLKNVKNTPGGVLSNQVLQIHLIGDSSVMEQKMKAALKPKKLNLK